MRIAIVTAGSSDYQELSDLTTPTKQRYAAKHGYFFHFFTTQKERGDACKLDCYEALRGSGYDLFVWSDLDSLIMNSDVSIEDLCHHYMGYDPDRAMDSGCHFLWGTDMGGPNSGVYFARYTPQAYHFMDRSYHHMLENGLADETSMEMTMLVPPFKDYVRVCRGAVFNAYDYSLYGWDKYGEAYGDTVNKYRPGSFILHYPGLPNEIRFPEIRKRLLEAT